MSLPFVWEPIDPFPVTRCNGFTYSPDLERAVFFNNEIAYYSDDGIHWSAGDTVPTISGPMVWNPVNSKFYCVGGAGTSNYDCFESSNGISWTNVGTIAAAPGHEWLSFLVDGLGKMYLLDDDGNVFRDGGSGGSSWTDSSNDLDTIDAVPSTRWSQLFLTNAGLFVAINSGSVINIPFATSPDAITWTGRHGFEPAFTGNDITSVDVNRSSGLAVATSESGILFWTLDGISWNKNVTVTLPNFPSQVVNKIIYSQNEGKWFAGGVDLFNELTFGVYYSTDSDIMGDVASWTTDSGPIPSVPDIFNPPDVLNEFYNITEAPEWERFFMFVDGDSDTPVITSPAIPGDNEITGDLSLAIEDASLVSLSQAEMIGDLFLEILLGDPHEIIGDLSLEIDLDPFTVYSADASGLYILVPGKTDDTIYLREAEDDVTVTTLDIAIPNPTVGTAYVGG